MDEPTINIEAWLGHVELRTWLEYNADRDRFIGMRETRHYDKDGLLMSCERGPSGVEAWFEPPALTCWQRLFSAATAVFKR
jgi:hypothetical protein